jgi:hypothetical protein
VEEQGSLTSLFTPTWPLDSILLPILLEGDVNVRRRKSLPVFARVGACRAAVSLTMGGVGGLTGPIKRDCVMVVQFGLSNSSKGLRGLCFTGMARWATNGVCVTTCKLRRLFAVGGVTGLCLLFMAAFSRPGDLLLPTTLAARLSRFGESSCIWDNLLLSLRLVGFVFSFIVDLCGTGIPVVDFRTIGL